MGGESDSLPDNPVGRFSVTSPANTETPADPALPNRFRGGLTSFPSPPRRGNGGLLGRP